MPLRRRPAARLLVTDPDGRILLFRFDHRTGALAGQSYWATPGGGVEAGESYEQAAIRELAEEAGILVARVGREIARRDAVFQLASGEYVVDEERYFHVQVSSDQVSLDCRTEYEVECMTAFRWWTAGELERASERISPENLLELARLHAAG